MMMFIIIIINKKHNCNEGCSTCLPLPMTPLRITFDCGGESKTMGAGRAMAAGEIAYQSVADPRWDGGI